MIRYKDSNYLISKDGYVQNEKTGRILKARTSISYDKVVMYINRVKVEKLVHRLVAELYIPNPNNYEIVNHINNNKLDNRVDNLEWCTQKMNVNHMVKQERQCRGINKPCSKLSEEQVLIIRKTYIEGKLSFRKIAEQYNVRWQTIQSIINRNTWKHI
jgi:hypothetical protein